jgi:hypothetical protein
VLRCVRNDMIGLVYRRLSVDLIRILYDCA